MMNSPQLTLTNYKQGCPLHPQCSFKWSINSIDAKKADVVLVLITDQTLFTQKVLHDLSSKHTHRPFKVVYQREALWEIPTGMVQKFDLDMSFRVCF